MEKHNHDHCKHTSVHYCQACRVAYCGGCGKEWRESYSFFYQYPLETSISWTVSDGNTSVIEPTAAVTTTTGRGCDHRRGE